MDPGGATVMLRFAHPTQRTDSRRQVDDAPVSRGAQQQEHSFGHGDDAEDVGIEHLSEQRRPTRPTTLRVPVAAQRIRAYRTFGSGWTSQILQQCLAVMLTDPLCRRQVRAAAKIYQRRNHALLAALRRRGIDGVSGGDCSSGSRGRTSSMRW